MSTKAQREIAHKLKVFAHAEQNGNVVLTCRYFGISRNTFYRWKKNYKSKGEIGLVNSKPCPQNLKLRTPAEIEDKIIYLRQHYHFGQLRISWYLWRYHQIKISAAGAYHVLKRHGMNRLPQNQRKRSIPIPQRYKKQVPGHHVQVDVKFLFFKDQNGKQVKRYQYTAIDDATRIRALKIYEKHNQANAIDFVNYVIDKFPFRIHTIQTDNGHEFQSKFHWHLNDLAVHHRYIKPRTPKHNGKVERSHKTDKMEFYQLLDYTDDVDLKAKLAEWEAFYNYARPHAAMNGKTPYERLKEKLC